MHFEHIMVTTDLSENAAVAYDLAAHQARFEGSRITLLYVVSDWVVPASFYEYLPQPVGMGEYRRRVVERAKAAVDTIAAKSFHDQKVTSVAIPSEEPPFKVICDYARQHGCGLIIMGTRGRGAIGSLFLGSNTQRVIQHAPCPVMVIPSRSDRTSTSEG